MKYSWDKIARIEKAIGEKYGTEAITHPQNDWTPEKERNYLTQVDEQIRSEQDNQPSAEKVQIGQFFVSSKLLNKTTITDQCPVCTAKLVTLMDDTCMSKYGTCFNCYIQYIEDREERWMNGWRPDSE